jgi:hypothetical protein
MSDDVFNPSISLTAEDNVSGVMGTIGASIDTLYSKVERLGALVGLGLGFVEFVKTGIEANATFDGMIVRTSTMLGVFEKWTGVTTGSAGALAMAREATEQLEKAQFSVMGTSEQLFGMYQRLLPVMVTSGATSTQQMVGFTTSVAKFADITGQSYDQLAGELSRMITTGQVLGRSEFGQMIRNLGITPEQIQSWRQSGELIDKLGGYLTAANVGVSTLKQGWTGVTGDIKKGAEEIIKEAFEPTFRMITDGAKTVRDALVTMTPGGAELNDSIVKPLQAAFLSAFTVIGTVVTSGWNIIRGIGDTAASAAGMSFSALLTNSFVDLGILLVNIWHETMGLLIPGIELLKHPIDAVLGILNSLISGVIGVASKIAGVLGMDGVAGYLGDLSEAYADVTAENNKFAQGITKGWEQNDGATGRALATLNAYKKSLTDPVMSTTPGAGGLLGGAPPLSQSQLDALQKARDLITKLNEDLGKTSGLTGYSEAVAKTDATFIAMNTRIDDAIRALGKLGLAHTAEGDALTALRTKEQNAYGGELQKDLTDAQKKYADAYVKIGKLASDNKDAQIEASKQAKLQELADLTELAAANVTSEDQALALVQLYEDKKRTIIENARLQKLTILDEQRGDWQAWANDMIALAVRNGENLVVATQKYWGEAATHATATAVTMAQGVNAAWLTIYSKVQTVGQSISTFMVSVWDSIGTAFSSGFYDVLSGKVHDLATVFKTFGDSILKTLSDVFTGILQRWILTVTGIKQNPITGKLDFSGASAGDSLGGMAGNGLVGAGLGYGIGSMSGAPGFSTGATIGGVVGGVAAGALSGAAVGSVAPIVGTIIGAIIGGLIGALASSNTEMSEFITPSDNNAAGFAMLQVANNVAAGALGLYATTGASASQQQDFGKSVQSYIGLHGAGGYSIHAGSDADMQADYQTLLTQIEPSELMHVLFGQQRTGPKDVAGIQGASNWSGVTDSSAPMVQMLTGLGFTMKAISNIAGQIDLESADAFGKYLTNLVGVVVGFNGLIKDLSMTPGQTFQSFADAANTSTASTFSTGAGNLVTLAQQLSLYTGDAQIAKAQELVSLGQQFQQSQLAYLKQLYDLQQSINASVAGQSRQMSLDLMTPGQQTSFYESELGTLMSQLAGAKTEDQVKTLMNQIEADTSALWSGNKTTAMQTWINQVLAQAQSLATQEINQFAAAATSQNAAVTQALTQAETLFTNLTPAVAAVTASTTANSTATTANTVATNDATTATTKLTAALAAAAGRADAFLTSIDDGSIPAAVIKMLQRDPSLLSAGTGR